jgi:hypothetical protein
MALLRSELQKDLQKQMKKGGELTNTITKWIELQDTLNSLFDASKASKTSEKDGTGIKQLLEKKEGLFRMKMMGKRLVHIRKFRLLGFLIDYRIILKSQLRRQISHQP